MRGQLSDLQNDTRFSSFANINRSKHFWKQARFERRQARPRIDQGHCFQAFVVINVHKTLVCCPGTVAAEDGGTHHISPVRR